MKLMHAITRKQGLSVEEFLRYWRGTHRPIAARASLLSCESLRAE